jgi:dihydrofolate reductase
MIVSFVVALASNGVIGKNNDLPWKLPDDMKFFMQKTKGHCVILGRKNFESLPDKYKPLPDRTNIVVTRNHSYSAPGCVLVHSIEEALEMAKKYNETEAMVIGGAEIYKLAFPYADRLYLTEIKAAVEGDTYFPDFNRSEWKEVERIPHAQDQRHAYAFDFVTYEKITTG